MTVGENPVTAGPIGVRERALAQDLARGLMLALIALANSVIYLYGRPYGIRQHIVEHHALDRVISTLLVTVVDCRAYPLLAALFADGVVQILQRQAAAGVPEPQAKRLLRRRSRWLVGFGLVHAVLLFPGDILGLYGMIGYLLKDAPREELFRAVRAAACGETVLSPPVAALLLSRIRPRGQPTETRLSGREREVLALIAQGSTNREVAAALYISEATVKTHLQHVYAKLEVPDRASAVSVAHQPGIL